MRTSSTLPLRDLSGLASAYTSQQLQITALETGLASQATNGNFLAAMTAASGAFSLGRALGTSLFSNVLGGAGLRGAAFALGFTSEVLTFRGVNQILTPGSESWLSASGIASTATDFLMMKGAGAFCGTSSYGVRQFVQASAMVGGEYAGESIGVREQSGQAFSERFAHALATGVAMEAGGILMRRATAGRIEALQRNLAHQSSILEQGHRSEAELGRASQRAFGMAAEGSELSTLLTNARRNPVVARALGEKAQYAPEIFEVQHIEAVIEAAAIQTKGDTALGHLARTRPELFSAEHLSRIIEMALRDTEQLTIYGAEAVCELVKSRSDLVTSDHVTAILKASQNHNLLAHALERLSKLKPGVFTADHIPAITERARGIESAAEREGATLLQLVLRRGEIFTAAHLPAMLEASFRQRPAGAAFGELMNSRPDILTGDAFIAMIAVEQAHQVIPSRSYLCSFTLANFDFFNGEILQGVIKAAKTQSMAASILHILAGRPTEGHAGPVHSGFTKDHIPGIIEAAKYESDAASALHHLTLRCRILFAPEHIPGVIEVARAHSVAGNALGVLVDSYPDSFTPNHVAAMVEVSIAHWNSSGPLRRLLQARPELRDAIPITRLVEGAGAPHKAPELLQYMVEVRPDLFTADHLLGMIEAVEGSGLSGSQINQALQLLVLRRPELITLDTFIRLVRAVKSNASLSRYVEDITVARLAYFTEEYLPPLLEAARKQAVAGSVLYTLVQERAELFTADHVPALVSAADHSARALRLFVDQRPGDLKPSHISAMIEGSKTHEQVAFALSHLEKVRSDLFVSDHIPAAIEAMGNPHHGEAAAFLGSLLTHRPELFQKAHVPAMFVAAQKNRAAMRVLSFVVQAQPTLFTPTQLRKVIVLFHDWFFNSNPSPR